MTLTEAEKRQRKALLELRREARRLAGDSRRRGVTVDDYLAAMRVERAAGRFREALQAA